MRRTSSWPFLAYCLHVTLRARLRPLAACLTPRAVDKLAAIEMLDVHFPTTDRRTLILSRYTKPNNDQNLAAAAAKETPRPTSLISRPFPPARIPS